MEAVRRALLADEEEHLMRAVELATGAYSSTIVEIEGGTTEMIREKFNYVLV